MAAGWVVSDDDGVLDMVVRAGRPAGFPRVQSGRRAINNALTPWLFALVLAVIGAVIAAPRDAAAAAVETVRVVVEQSYVYRERTSIETKPIASFELPLAELAVDLLVGAGVDAVGPEATAFDASLRITARGEALGVLYADADARYLYTGASVRGALAFQRGGASVADSAFVGQINRQRKIERDLGYDDPANAPFDGALRAPGSYMDRLVELIGAAYGAPALASALLDGDPRLRPTAARVMGDLGDTTVVPDDAVRWQAAGSLGRLGDQRAIAALIEALGDRDPDVRWFSAWSLSVMTGQTLGDDQDAWAAWHQGEAGN
jgi:hypothetical protein